jgi:hypothetical protein
VKPKKRMEWERKSTSRLLKPMHMGWGDFDADQHSYEPPQDQQLSFFRRELNTLEELTLRVPMDLYQSVQKAQDPVTIILGGYLWRVRCHESIGSGQLCKLDRHHQGDHSTQEKDA